MSRNTLEPCPSCGYAHASHWHSDGPPEIFCKECHFEWQGSPGNLSPDDEAAAHRALREEAAAYQDPEDREEET